ncbi:beta-galactosidase [Deinococcus seoulensis]|uniref:Beta-galactosidase n=1 Tax=Deinococcus seoulensis TaxID=1837379 RepID=A0ABQ2RRL8_9DEIO|nr:beta-galactosidase [Deinococcus seoulensis]GGR60443.1 beta-galactosidase [Deinococcus seoulensis]
MRDHTHPSSPSTPRPAPLTLGVCDYPEHVDPATWPEHARQQRALGLHFVRLAEFAWSRLEPRPGEFDWAWLDQAIEVAVAAGLQVVLCTPTAAPPAWLVEAHPEILPVGRDGRRRTAGSRRHADLSSPAFREASVRITQAMAERYGTHPALIGWQTDNEFGWGDTAQSFTPAAQAAFQAWLRERYGTTDALNDAWGNVFWSMEYSDWTQIPLPGQGVSASSPSHVLDFMRFSSGQVAAFQADQVALLRRASPGRFVTHNFMGYFSAFDHYEVAAGLDFAAWDNYPTGTLGAVHEWNLLDPSFALTYARTGHPDVTAFNHDLYRGLTGAGRGLWILEQQCGQVDWAPSNPLPAPGAVNLWTAQAWAHGADAVTYFRWQAATMAQEIMHSGLLRHDGTPDRGAAEVAGTDPARYPCVPVRNRVALLHDYESLWLYGAQPHAQGMSYWAQVFTYYRELRRMGVDVDILHPDSPLDRYDLIVAPALTLMTPERARHLRRAAGHSRVVFGPRTAFRTASGRAAQTAPGSLLAQLTGARLQNFDSLPAGLTQPVGGHGASGHGVGGHGAALWAESYVPEDPATEVLHRYAGGPLDGEAAVTRRGLVTLIGAHSPSLIGKVLAGALRDANIPTLNLPEGVRLSRRGEVTLLQNWNAHPVTWCDLTLAPVSTTFLNSGDVQARAAQHTTPDTTPDTTPADHAAVTGPVPSPTPTPHRIKEPT